MTKRYYYLILILIIALGTYLFLRQNPVPLEDVPATVKQEPLPKPESIEEEPPDVVPPNSHSGKKENDQAVNAISPDWQTNLENTLRTQGGDSVKDIEIKKVDSLVWTQDGVSLNVESVIVTIKNQLNQTTTFRVLVDAQNGKILNNWDQPIIEYADPTRQPRIKVDPRYHND